MKSQKTFPAGQCIVIVTVLLLLEGLVGTALGCDYYASPAGTGNGSSQSSPFRIRNFWSVAKPGSTLCLLDGIYQGRESMIDPPDGLSGTQSAPITVKALNDGKVTIDAQKSRRPVRLYYNNYFVLEGFNAHSSSDTVVELSRSNYNIVRRIAAWDAADGNDNIFGIHRGNNNLLEDVAGWGIARKIFSSSQGGDFTTIRRAWGSWDGSHFIGPKMTYTLTYNNYHMICENCIGTWSGEKMRQSYQLLCPDGATNDRCGQTYTNYKVDQPYGILAMDTMTRGSRVANSKYLGSIAYIRTGDAAASFVGMVRTSNKVDGVEVKDIVAYIEPGTHDNLKPFSLPTLHSKYGGPSDNHRMNNTTEIGGTNSWIASDWQVTNRVDGDTAASAPNIFNGAGSKGARVCKRYVDGTLTSVPLWPWPMNQRIIDAMIESGRKPVDVTETIEQMFGPIPSECKLGTASTTSSTNTPSSPTDLQAIP